MTKFMTKTELEEKLSSLLNSESRENDSNTPDYILAEFMMNCLDAFELASNKREVWFGITLDILNDWEGLIMKAVKEASMCWSKPTNEGVRVFQVGRAEQIGKKLLEDIKSGLKGEI